MMGREGRVFDDRYHARVLRTPTEVRHAIHYVRTTRASMPPSAARPTRPGTSIHTPRRARPSWRCRRRPGCSARAGSERSDEPQAGAPHGSATQPRCGPVPVTNPPDQRNRDSAGHGVTVAESIDQLPAPTTPSRSTNSARRPPRP
jgi:hypothetical protein